ncbi:MAG: hypothetical protein IPK19_26750 [Chloroflexi bacterium]|nr:hypothetical protein [Chloroflexota bacterium]
MIEPARLESALIAVARRYAPALVPAGWMGPGDYPFGLANLARRLSDQGALVMAAEVRADVPDAAMVVKDWADTYIRLYNHLCATLFPSFMQIGAAYVDQAEPPIAVLSGECAPVMAAMGGYIAPYVASRGGARPSDMELRGVIDVMLEALEAVDLPREAYVRLRDEAASIVRRLLDVPIRQWQVTPAARGIVGASLAEPLGSDAAAESAPPPGLPESPMPPTMPTGMPEAPGELARTPPAPPSLPETPARESTPPFAPDAIPIFSTRPGRVTICRRRRCRRCRVRGMEKDED